MRQELVLQFRHVHIRGTFRLTALAFEAEIERFVKLFAGEVVSRKLSGKDLAHQVGAASCRVLVFQRDHVGRAHRAFVLLAAYTRAVTQFNCSSESALTREIVMRVDWDRAVFGSVTKVLGHWRRIDDLPGIHSIFWIECLLHIAKGFIDLGAEQFLVQMASSQAIAMFAAHSAAEFDDEIGNLVGHVFHDLDFAAILCIDQRADVQASDAGVAVIAGTCIVFVYDFAKAKEELRQLGRIDRAIFDKRDRFTLALHAKQQAQAGFAHLPDAAAALPGRMRERMHIRPFPASEPLP